MFFLTLWDQCLSHTMPSLSDGGVILIYLQIFLCSAPSLVTLYRSVRRENGWETVMLAMVPGIFIVTAAIIEPLFFGSFLGSGFPWVDALRQFLDTPAFFRDALALAGVFALLAVLYLIQSRQSRFLVLHILLSMGVEVFVTAAVLFFSVDYLLLGGRLFFDLSDSALKWMVYGTYLLAYKGALFLVCLVWGTLFGERRDRTAERGNYAAWLRRYCTGSYRAIGIGQLLLSALLAGVVVRGLYQEGSVEMARICLLLNIVLLLWGLGALLASFFPALLPSYRRICSWGDLDETAQLLYHELRELPPRAKTSEGLVTRHFLIYAAPVRQIYRRDLLERAAPLGYGLRLRFKDGGKCTISAASRHLLDVMEELREVGQ